MSNGHEGSGARGAVDQHVEEAEETARPDSTGAESPGAGEKAGPDSPGTGASASSSPHAEAASADSARSEKEGNQSPFRFSYSARLAGAFALIAVMTALIAAGILAVVWGNQFQSYARDNMETLARQTASQVGSDYEMYGGFTYEVLSRITNYTGSSGVAIQVIDSSGNVVYDDSWTLSSGSVTGASLSPSKEQVVSSPIIANGSQVGVVNVWSYGSSSLLTQKDLQFRSNSYKAIIIATIIAVILAANVGFLFARGLVGPIKRITRTAKEVKEGDLDARTNIRGADEISELGEMFDEMADSIQRDRELERRLTTDVAHELRTPLMGIQATTEAIMDGVFPPDEERLSAINSETLRLKRLVDALLNLSKLESGAVEYKEQTLDVVDLVKDLYMSHEALLEDSDLTLILDADDHVYVDGDPDMLGQATANLISNAVRYNKPGGTVTLGVHKRGDMAAISVADTGIGVAPEDKEKIFSRFWRADAARNRASGGLGVGLAVVKELVDYNNGKIEVDSELGEGTTFTILIPLHVEPESKTRQGRGISSVLESVSQLGRGDSGKIPKAEKVAAKEAKDAEKAAEKEARDAEKAAAREAKDAEKEAREAARSAEREAREAAKQAEREAKEAAKLAEREAREAAKQADRVAKEAGKATKKGTKAPRSSNKHGKGNS